MALLLYRYRHALRLNFTMLRNLCWTRYLTNFYKISFLHWVSIGNFIFINFFPKCSCEAVKCLYFSWPGADMVLHALPCTFVHLPLVYRTPRLSSSSCSFASSQEEYRVHGELLILESVNVIVAIPS